MTRTLQELGAWPLYAAAALIAIALLARVLVVRRRRQRAVLREVDRLRREMAVRDAVESGDPPPT